MALASGIRSVRMKSSRRLTLPQAYQGEVYRARDTKLDRDVAIKVLPEEFASDPVPGND